MLPINTFGMYAIGIVLLVLSTLAVFARFCVRQTKKAGYRADDWTALIGLMGLWIISGITLAGIGKGFFGSHTILDPATHEMIITHESKNVQYQWVVLLLTITIITFIKLSVVFLYRRIFEVSRTFSVYSIILCTLLILWAVAFSFAIIFQCGKRPWAFWTGAKAIIKYCDDTSAVSVSFCATDLALDLLVVLAPIPVIWKLHISTSRKLQVLGVFAMGLLSTAASAARLYIMYMDSYGATLGYRDVMGQNSEVVIWSIVEVSAALIGCCLPTLRPLFSSSSRSLGTFLRSIRSTKSLASSQRESAHDQNSGDGLAFASIGGTKFQGLWKRDPSIAAYSTHASSGKEDGSFV